MPNPRRIDIPDGYRADFTAMLIKSADLLRKQMKPIRYVELCEKTLTLVECEPYADASNAEEMLRNRLAYDSKQRFVLSGGYVAMNEWIRSEQQFCLPLHGWGQGLKPLLFEKPKGCWRRGEKYAQEIHNDGGFKNPYNKDPQEHLKRAQLGYGVEYCVSEWLEKQFPEYFWCPPQNKPTADCIISINDHEFKIDVKSTDPRYPNSAVVRKKRLEHDMNYLFAEPHKEDEIAVRGWLPGHRISERNEWYNVDYKHYEVPYKSIYSMQTLMFRMNCALMNLDYRIFKDVDKRQSVG